MTSTTKTAQQISFEVADKINLNNLPEDLRENEYLEVGERPWGVYYVLEDKPNYKVKKIVVQPGKRLSLQSHKHRSEHWIVVSGSATVEIHPENVTGQNPIHKLYPNQSCYIPIEARHRLSNEGHIPLVIIEVQVGEFTGEEDITRYEDDYSRV